MGTLYVKAQSLVDWDAIIDGKRIARIENIGGYKRGRIYGVGLFGVGETLPDGTKYDYKIVNSYKEAIGTVRDAFGVPGPVKRWPGGYYSRGER